MYVLFLCISCPYRIPINIYIYLFPVYNQDLTNVNISEYLFNKPNNIYENISEY